MVNREEAEETLNEAHDFANWDPERQIQEFFIVKEIEVDASDEENSADENGETAEPEMELEINELPLHKDIHVDLNSLFVEELFKVKSNALGGDEGDFIGYRAGNIERDEKPIQYLDIEDIPDYDVFEPFTRESGFEEAAIDEFGSPDFQVLRVRDGLGKMFIAFRKFSNRQIVGSSWKVKMLLRDDEYNEFREDLVALPENIDAFVYDEVAYVVNQGRFEDIFNYFELYKERADEVIASLRNSELKIHNLEEFEKAVKGDRYALRKMVDIEERGLYDTIDREKVERVIEDYDLNLNPITVDGEWGIVMPSRRDKRDIIRLLNDDHLVSEITEEKYQARSKRQV